MKIVIIFLLFIFYNSFGGEKFLNTKKYTQNGTTIILRETKGPGIVAGTIFIVGGSVEDPAGKRGLTNLTLKLLLQGSKNYDSLYINKFFESSGGYIGASASEEVSTIDFAVRTEDFDKAMDIIADVLQNPLFPEEKLRIEIENTKAQIRAKKEEGIAFAFEKLRADVFKDSPYEVSPLGKEEELDNIGTQDLKNRWKQLYASGRFIVSIVGDMPVRDMEKSISKLKIPDGKRPEFKAVNLNLNNSCSIYNREGAQSTILMLYPAPNINSHDYFSFRLLNAVLGSGFTSKLFQELREKKGYAYAVGSTYNPRFSFGTMVSYIGTSPQKTEDAIKDMKEVIASFPSVITDEDLNTAKEKIVGDFLMAHQTRAKQAYFLGWFELIGLGYQYDEKFPEIIKSIKLEDVVSAYKKYLTDGFFCLVVKP